MVEHIMKKCILKIVLLVFIGGMNASALAKNQMLEFSEVKAVFSEIKNNDWIKVEQLASKIAVKNIPAKENLIGRMRYIYLIAIAKNLEAKKYGFDGLAKRLNLMKGKLIVQPWHPVKSGGGSCFNAICDSDENKKLKVTAQSDNAGTQIYSFEYFNMGREIELASFDGLNARMGGILEKIEINRNLQPALKENHGVSWYFRYRFKNAFIQFDI